VHTPGHAVINVAALGTALDPALAAPIIAGAVLPDVPIMVLYLKERILHKTPENVIWSDHYQRRFWQDLIHGTHSLPLAAIGLAIALAAGSMIFAAFFASVLLHAAADLPVHAEDAHRHFFPFSNYRFESPISYWDVRRHGKVVALVEMLIVFAASVVLWGWYVELWSRALVVLVDIWYVVNYARSYL
jgi:hypothetical protein